MTVSSAVLLNVVEDYVLPIVGDNNYVSPPFPVLRHSNLKGQEILKLVFIVSGLQPKGPSQLDDLMSPLYLVYFDPTEPQLDELVRVQPEELGLKESVNGSIGTAEKDSSISYREDRANVEQIAKMLQSCDDYIKCKLENQACSESFSSFNAMFRDLYAHTFKSFYENNVIR